MMSVSQLRLKDQKKCQINTIMKSETFGSLNNPSNTLYKKAIRAGFWAFSLRAIVQLLNFAKIVILARLLSPSDFGLFGVALLSLSILEAFSQTGFQNALIHKKEDIQSFLNTSWSIEIIRSLLISIVLFSSSSYIAVFFKVKEVSFLIKVISLVIVIKSLSNISVLFFQKELEFEKIFKYEFSSALINAFVSIVLALVYQTVWALVVGLLAGSMVKLLMSYKIDSYRPRFELDFLKVKELWKYGKWVFWSNIVVFLSTKGDDILIAKILGPVSLGLYQVAFTIGNTPSSEFTGVVGKVVFPAYAKLQDSPGQLKNAYFKTISFVTFFSFPLAGGMMILATLFIQIFLGEKWMFIEVPMQILALSGIFRSIAGTGGAMFNAIGKPKLDFKMNLVRLIIISISIFPLILMWGISGAAASVLLGIIGTCFIWLFESIKEIKTKINDYLIIFLLPLIGTIIMCGVMVAIIMIFSSYNQILTFSFSVFLGTISYICSMYYFEKYSNYKMLSEIKLMYKNL